MKRPATYAVALLAAATTLECSSAHAQARGPSVQETRENGQYVEPDAGVRPPTRLVYGWMDVPIGEPAPDVELAALGPAGVLDEAQRRARLAALETWFRRLPGRYRIDGVIEAAVIVRIEVIKGNQPETLLKFTTFKEKVSGVADCTAVGEGVGVQCILNATWPTLPDIPMFGPPAHEQLNTLQPAMLVMGLNLDPPGVRALLVTDDSIAHTWAGALTDDILTADRLTDCAENQSGEYRCLQPLQIVVPPDCGIVTIILRRTTKSDPPREMPYDSRRWLTRPRPLSITLTMYPDPEAKPEKPMPTKKVR